MSRLNDLAKKLAVSKFKPEMAKDMTPTELAELVLVVLGYVNEVKQLVEAGKVKGEKGDPGYTPMPDKDYISPRTMAERVEKIMSDVVDKAEKDIKAAIKSIPKVENGKDAVITKAMIREAAEMAFEMIEIPDFATLITQEPETIRNALELLSGDDRLEMSAINGLEEKLAEIKNQIEQKVSSNRGGGGGARALALLSDVSFSNLEDGQISVYNAAQQRWINQDFTAGGGAWGAITGTLSDQTDLQNALDLKADAADLADYVLLTDVGAADGVAPLGADSKVPSSYLPALALTDVYVVVDQTAQLALTAQEGDVAIRTDQNKSYIHNGGTAGNMSDWSELLTPTDLVLSVNGQTGAITLNTSHISESGNLYYTDERVDDRVNSLLIAGVAIAKTYDDNGNTLSIDFDLTELTAETSIANDDYVVIYDTSAGAHRKMTKANFVAGLSGGAPAWGTITGTLADQTDLQTALDAKQPLDADLTALAGLTSAANKLPYFTGSGTAALADFTAFARSILDDADEATFKATVNLEIGTDVQAYDADLAAIAALAPTNDDIIQRKAGAWTNRTMAQLKSDLALTKSDVGLGNVSNVDQIPLSYLDTDVTLAANSDAKVASQKAIKAYVDGIAQGLDIKASVRVATTTAGTLATSFENGDTVDGVVLATGNRILIKDQAAPAENGIYVVAASGAPTRATDADSSADVTTGMFVFVSEGTTNADSGWVLTTNDTITLGTTGLAFSQFSGAGQITAGNALTKSGNQLDVAVDGVGIEINSDALRLKDGGVTLAKMANMATDSFLGRDTAGTGAPEVLTPSQVKTILAIAESEITFTDITTNNASTTKHGYLKKLDNTATNFMDGTGNWDSVKDSDLSTSDITTNDVSTSKHGFAPKAPNDTTKFLRGDGTWAVPAASASNLKSTLTEKTGVTISQGEGVFIDSAGEAIKAFALKSFINTDEIFVPGYETEAATSPVSDFVTCWLSDRRFAWVAKFNVSTTYTAVTGVGEIDPTSGEITISGDYGDIGPSGAVGIFHGKITKISSTKWMVQNDASTTNPTLTCFSIDDDNVITAGSVLTLSSNMENADSAVVTDYIEDDKFIIARRRDTNDDCEVTIGTVSGTTITVNTGGWQIVDSGVCNYMSVKALSTTQAIVSWNDGTNLEARICNYGTGTGNTTITLGSGTATVEAVANVRGYMERVSDTSFVICWRVSASSLLRSRAGTIDTNTITFGSTFDFRTGAGGNVRVTGIAPCGKNGVAVASHDTSSAGNNNYMLHYLNIATTTVTCPMFTQISDVAGSSLTEPLSNTTMGKGLEFVAGHLLVSVNNGRGSGGSDLGVRLKSYKCSIEEIFLGVAEANSAADVVTNIYKGRTGAIFSGLTYKGEYFVDTDGVVRKTGLIYVGQAIKTTEILIP